MTALYRCASCRFEWTARPGPTMCPCGEVYVEWSNFEEMRAGLEADAERRSDAAEMARDDCGLMLIDALDEELARLRR